jgi:PAS domain S-box-containing protein
MNHKSHHEMKVQPITIIQFPGLTLTLNKKIDERLIESGFGLNIIKTDSPEGLIQIIKENEAVCCIFYEASGSRPITEALSQLRNEGTEASIFVVVDPATVPDFRAYFRAGANDVFLSTEPEEIASALLHLLSKEQVTRKSGDISGIKIQHTPNTFDDSIPVNQEMMLRWLVNSSEEYMLLLNPEGIVLMVNAFAAERLGKTIEEMLGRSVFPLLPDELVETRRRMLQEVIETGEQLRFEDRRAGVWIQHHLQPVIERNEVVAVAVYAIDVNEQRSAREALAESELRLRLALDASQLGLYDLNVVTGEAKVNRRYAEMMGYEPDDFVETNDAWIERLHPDDRLPVTSAYMDYVSGASKEYVVEFRQKHKDGHWMWVLSLGKIMERGADGKPLRMLGTHLDITEKKNNEIRIERELGLRKLLFDVSNDGIVLIDTLHMVVEANSRFCDMLGYSEEELRGMKTWEFDSNMDEQAIRSGFAPGMPINERFESIHRRKNGSTYHVEVSAKDFIWNDQWFVLCVCRDISERKLAEAAIRQKINELELSRSEALKLASSLSEEILDHQEAKAVLLKREEQIQQIFDHTPIGLLSFDEKGVITACNDQFVQIIGSSRELLVGLNMTQLPDQNVVGLINDALKGKEGSYTGSYSSMTANKQTDVRLKFSPILNHGIVKGGVGIVEDISAEVASARRRIELEQRFAKSFYSSPVAMAITLKSTGEFVDVNDAYIRLTGYDREQVMGQTVTGLGIVEEEGRNRLVNTLDKLGYINQEEVLLKMRNNEQRVILISFEIYELSGESHLLSTLIDITERKQYEAELTKLTRAVEQSPVSIVITDLEGTIEYVNPKVVETTGYLPGELIGKNPRVFSSGELTQEEYMNMYKTISQGQTWQGEFHNRKKNGELYWESATISPVINDEGEMTHYIAVKEDITNSKRLQQELMESEQLYKSMFMGSPVPMWIYDLETLRFVEVNNQALYDYGYTKEEFGNMTIADIRPPEDKEHLIQDIRSNTDTSQGPSLWRHLKKDGSQIDVEISSHALPATDGKKQRMVMAYNVTDRQKAKIELEKAKALAEASDRLKTAFLNNISHEVRTPLNGILGAVNIINEPDLSRDDMAEMLEIINESTERLIRTITDYMDISLINSGNLEYRPKKQSITAVIRQVADNFRWTASRKNIDLRLDLSDSFQSLELETDGELLSKAMYQLVHNAIKYCNQGHVTIGLKREETQLLVYVQDTGIGISKESLENVFEPFSQEDMSTSRKYEGSGLGLAIVKGIMDVLGGTVAVESEKGVGSVFRLYLHQEEPVSVLQAAEPPAVITVKPQEAVVLIAEDDDSNFVVLELLLRQMSTARLIRARNGEEAVKIALSEPDICLVLMDLKMPLMDGLEATRLIKAQKPELNIVAITAYAMSGDEYKALSAGCNDYIAKPVALKTLKQKIEGFGVPLKPSKSIETK